MNTLSFKNAFLGFFAVGAVGAILSYSSNFFVKNTTADVIITILITVLSVWLTIVALEKTTGIKMSIPFAIAYVIAGKIIASVITTIILLPLVLVFDLNRESPDPNQLAALGLVAVALGIYSFIASLVFVEQYKRKKEPALAENEMLETSGNAPDLSSADIKGLKSDPEERGGEPVAAESEPLTGSAFFTKVSIAFYVATIGLGILVGAFGLAAPLLFLIWPAIFIGGFLFCSSAGPEHLRSYVSIVTSFFIAISILSVGLSVPGAILFPSEGTFFILLLLIFSLSILSGRFLSQKIKRLVTTLEKTPLFFLGFISSLVASAIFSITFFMLFLILIFSA